MKNSCSSKEVAMRYFYEWRHTFGIVQFLVIIPYPPACKMLQHFSDICCSILYQQLWFNFRRICCIPWHEEDPACLPVIKPLQGENLVCILSKFETVLCQHQHPYFWEPYNRDFLTPIKVGEFIPYWAMRKPLNGSAGLRSQIKLCFL